MKKIISVAAIAVMVAFGSVNAQKPLQQVLKPGENAPKPQNTEQGKLQKPNKLLSQLKTLKPGEMIDFVGMITYRVTSDDNEKAYVKREGRPGEPVAAAVEKKGPDKPIKKDNDFRERKIEPVKAKSQNVAYFLREGTFMSIQPFAIKAEKDRYPMICYQPLEGELLCSEMEGIEWPLTEKSDKMYENMGKKKVIAGVECTLYRCHLPKMEGEIWVAEQLKLTGSNAPFYGLKHPVLEFDIIIMLEGKEVNKYHLVALDVNTEIKDKESMIRMMGGKMIPQPEILEMYRSGK